MTAAVARNLAEGAQRARRSEKRRKALRNALTGGPVPADMPTTELAGHAARVASRQALAFARAHFDQSLADNVTALAQKMIELGLEGNPQILMTIARTLQPPAKYDSTKVELDIGPIQTLEDIDRARRRLAEAVFSGRVGVEDSGNLARLLDSLAEADLRQRKAELLNDMRTALSDASAGSVTARIGVLTQKAELVLKGGKPGVDVPFIEAEPIKVDDGGGGTVEDDDSAWQQFL
jgi:hypothetical protein